MSKMATIQKMMNIWLKKIPETEPVWSVDDVAVIFSVEEDSANLVKYKWNG